MSKKVTLLFCFVVGFVLLSILAVGCSTTKGHGDAGTIISYQQQIDRLEEELRTRDRTIENAVRELGAITSRSEAMEGSDCYTTMTKYEQKLKTRAKIIFWLIIILVIRFICLGIGLMLYFRGIKLPRWLDIIL